MRTPIAARIKTPFLSAGNWGGLGLHLRGNVTAFTDAASTLKWLEMHTDTHFASMYLSEAVALQQRFFDCFLKGEANGFRDEPRLLLTIRDPRGAYRRKAACWPLPETLWTRYHLDAASRSMSTTAPSVEASVAYDALQEEVTFFTTPFAADTEFTGPIAVKLFVSSSKARIAFTLDRHTKAMLSCRGCDSTPISESCARFADRTGSDSS